MSWKARQREIKLRILVRQNRGTLALMVGWLLLSIAILVAGGMDPLRALRVTTYFEECRDVPFGFFYQSMTDIVGFGFVISALLANAQQQIRPEITSRILAQELEDHAVVITFSNLGKRIFDLLAAQDIPVAAVDADPEKLKSLIHDGYPCLVGSGRSLADLEGVSVAKAKLVVLACDELETVSVLSSLVRKLNSTCTLIVRCAEDDIGEVLAKRYNAVIISTSKMASDFVKEYATKHKVEKCLIVGCDSVARRLIPVLTGLKCKFAILSDDAAGVDDLLDEVRCFIGKVSDDDLLDQAGIRECDLVVLTEDNVGEALIAADRIRQVNTTCRIICRVYHDDAADMIAAPPFKCDVISTSRHAVDRLKKQGAFQAVGLGSSKK